jgi:GNAT superfamily N-acetyltransferase
MSEARRRYLDDFRRSVGLADLASPATHIVIEDDRAGSNLIVGYAVEAKMIVRAGPEHADLVEPLRSDEQARTFGELCTWAAGNGWVEFDGGLSHVADPDDLGPAPIPAGLQGITLEPNGADSERVLAWLRAADPGDLDEGAFDLDELDDRMVALTDSSDNIVALASCYPWETAPTFEDIGVIVAPSARGQGAGRAVVRLLLDSLHDDGQLGLYRCNWSNPTSRRLALGLGFQQVTDLVAFCPVGDPKAKGPTP